MRLLFLGLILVVFGAKVIAQEPRCAAQSPCETAHGSYHMMMPSEWDGTSPLPVLIFFHGHRASGRMIYNSGGLRKEFAERGWLVVAPNGTPIPDSRSFSWPGTAKRQPEARDDVAFVAEVIEDLRNKVPVGSVFASGFSAGGSMAWMLACHAPSAYDGFASVAGTLRQPQSAECQSDPVKLIQIHGFSDNQVPFEGRAIGGWHQGDLFSALDGLRDRNRCRSHPDRIEVGPVFRCRDWDDSCDNAMLRLCEHDGGHGMPAGWARLVRDYFDAD